MKSLIFASLFLLPISLFAAVLEGKGQLGEVEKVKIAEAAQATLDGRSYGLKLVGAGLRYKKVAFFKANVYVGELFVGALEKFDKKSALDSLAQEKAVAMRLTFLRDVDGGKVSGGFKEGLEHNKVKLDDPAIKAFLEAVKSGGEAKEKSTLLVMGEKISDEKEAVTFESSSGKTTTVSGPKGLVRSVFSIWFGSLNDSGLENLRDEIFKFRK